MKSWKRLPALNFMVLNFVVRLIANDVMWNVNFELGIHGAYFLLRWGTLQCWVLCEKLVSQTRPKQTQCRSLTKDYLHLWYLVGLALRDYATAYHTYKDISFGRPRTGEQLLCQCENNNRADSYAVMAVKSLLQALPCWTRGTGPVFCWSCFCLLC